MDQPMTFTKTVAPAANKNFWEAYAMSLDDVTDRFRRITGALAGLHFADLAPTGGRDPPAGR